MLFSALQLYHGQYFTKLYDFLSLTESSSDEGKGIVHCTDTYLRYCKVTLLLCVVRKCHIDLMVMRVVYLVNAYIMKLHATYSNCW